MDQQHGILIECSRIRDGIMRIALFTPHEGLMTGLLRIAGKKTNVKIRPLCLISYEISNNRNSEVLWFQNIALINPLFNIYNDVVKQCIVLYLQELLIKITVPLNPNIALYRFLVDSINLLDDSHRPANFPFWATMEIIRHQGFLPDVNQINEMSMDANSLSDSDNLGSAAAELIRKFLPLDWSQVSDYAVSSSVRRLATNMLIHYLSRQLDLKSKFHSVEMLHDVLHA
ncbi:MAG: DNA repair protein RecO [Flavobacteriales bacterium]